MGWGTRRTLAGISEVYSTVSIMIGVFLFVPSKLFSLPLTKKANIEKFVNIVTRVSDDSCCGNSPDPKVENGLKPNTEKTKQCL